MKKLSIIFLLFITINAFGQDAPPLGGSPEPAPGDAEGVPAVPIDGGITAFLLAGGVLGLKLIYSGKKYRKTNT